MNDRAPIGSLDVGSDDSDDSIVRAMVDAGYLRGTVTVGALTIDDNGKTGTDTLITIDDAATGEQLFQLEGDAS